MASRVARQKILSAWEPPARAGEPIGVVASTFTFDAEFFEEELLARFFCLETSSGDSRAYCAERETRLGEAVAAVLVDRRHATRTSTLAWDVLPVPVPYQCCQHSKVSVLAWERAIRVVVASANLTAGSYRRNLEVFATLDFAEGSAVPRSVLTGVLDFMRRLVARVPSPGGAGPVQRTLGLLDSILRLGGELPLAENWSLRKTTIVPVFLEPQGPGVLDRMSELWGNGPQPQLIRLCSPFWAAAKDGANPVLHGLAERMAARGDRRLELLIPGEPDADGDWVVQAPAGAFDGVDSSARRLAVEVYAVPAAQDEEHRPLHGKIQRWSRENGPDLLLIGSSNATEAGLGLGTGPRNIEANLCFIGDGERSTRTSFNATFPVAERVEGTLKYLEREAREEGDQSPPLSEFFKWAEYKRVDNGGRLAIAFSLDTAEPEGWSLTLATDGEVLNASDFRKLGRPIEFSLVLSGKKVPFVVKVRWLDVNGPQSADLPVNAADDVSRDDPRFGDDLDLDTLLDTLASGLPLWRRLVEIAQRQKRSTDGRFRSELDPHGRIDTSAFLMQRMRRISRALEGLRERLAAPVATQSSLEWRFRGLLGPATVAKILAASLAETDVAFILAELALAVARASQTVRADGVDATIVQARFLACINEIGAMKPAVGDNGALESYVARAFDRARAMVGRRLSGSVPVEPSKDQVSA